MAKIVCRAEDTGEQEYFSETEIRSLGGPEEAASEFVANRNLSGDILVTTEEQGCWPRILFRKTVDELR
jgi:hypothetical protein